MSDDSVDTLPKLHKPNSVPFHTDLGLTLLDLGDVDKAIEALKKAIQLDSNYALAHFYLALAYQEKSVTASNDADKGKFSALAANQTSVLVAQSTLGCVRPSNFRQS